MTASPPAIKVATEAMRLIGARRYCATTAWRSGRATPRAASTRGPDDLALAITASLYIDDDF